MLRGALLATLLLGVSSGCGAKTGLETPDAPRDARDAYARDEPCIEAPPTGPIVAELGLPASLRVVDLMMVIDTSASMRDEIDGVRSGLRSRVVPAVRALIPDAAFGVALFGEFPVAPHAEPGDDVGPYVLRTPLTLDVGRVEATLERTPVWGNRDIPEAGIEALYQVSTGAGLPPWIEPSFGCPSGGRGGACFRDEAFHVALLVTDAPLHNGPPGVPPVSNYAFRPPPHSFGDAMVAATALDLRVIGLAASDFDGGDDALRHLTAIARATGAVDASGAALAFDIGSRGDGIGEQVISAVQRLAEALPLDVDAIVEDVSGDAFDAREVVVSVRPLRAMPMSAITGIEGASFRGVRPGTRLTFEITVDASRLPVPTESTRIPARLVLRESSRARLGSLDFVIVLPHDGPGCPAR